MSDSRNAMEWVLDKQQRKVDQRKSDLETELHINSGDKPKVGAQRMIDDLKEVLDQESLKLKKAEEALLQLEGLGKLKGVC